MNHIFSVFSWSALCRHIGWMGPGFPDQQLDKNFQYSDSSHSPLPALGRAGTVREERGAQGMSGVGSAKAKPTWPKMLSANHLPSQIVVFSNEASSNQHLGYWAVCESRTS